MGGSYEFILHKGYPVLNNDAEVNDWMRQVTADLVGEDAIVDAPGGMGAEDFSYMAQAAPGAMFNLGAQVENGGGHHTPTFAISEDVFPIGAAIMAETARRFVTGQLE